MDQIKAFVYINLKILMIDKLSFLWSMILPIVMLVINRGCINLEEDLLYWWIYIVMNSYIYGVGLYALNMRGQGILKTLFSISNKPIEFFVANLVTQIIYSLICCTVFNMIAMFFFSFNFFKMCAYTVVVICILIPIAFLSYNITQFENLYYSTVSIIVNIIMFIMLSFAGNKMFGKYNPINYYSNLIVSKSSLQWIKYCFIHIVLVLCSIKSIREYTPIVRWKR